MLFVCSLFAVFPLFFLLFLHSSRESAAVAEFRVFEKDADTAVAVAAIRSLTGVMKR